MTLVMRDQHPVTGLSGKQAGNHGAKQQSLPRRADSTRQLTRPNSLDLTVGGADVRRGGVYLCGLARLDEANWRGITPATAVRGHW